MGNQHSDATEENLYNFIRQVPILSQAYSPVRAIVYAGKQDEERVEESAVVALGPIGQIMEHQSRPFQPLDIVLLDAQPGDLLEFNRGAYFHYALYLGDGQVMNPDEGIYQCSAEHACEDNPTRISNHDEFALKHFNVLPRCREKIVECAKSYASQGNFQYELMFRNCEYYCTLFRFGKGFSTQVIYPSSTPYGATAVHLLPQVKIVEETHALLKLKEYQDYCE